MFCQIIFKVEFPEKVDENFIRQFENFFPRPAKTQELTGEEEAVDMMPWDPPTGEGGPDQRERQSAYEEELMDADDQPAGCRQS